MTWLHCELVATQPLLLGNGPSVGNLGGSYGHVPGSVVRGALAAAWIRDHGAPTRGHAGRPAFLSLFEGEARFGPFHVTRGRPAPLSVRVCKYRPVPGCLDTAVDDAYSDPAAPAPTTCSCGGPLERVRGTSTSSAFQRTSVRLSAASTPGGGERAEALFTRRGVPAGTVFAGSIDCPDDQVEAVRALSGPVRVGGRRSASGGAEFSARIGEQPAPSADEDPARVVVRLDAPAVVLDRWTRPLTTIDPDEVADLIGAPVQVERHWTRIASIGGWHQASGTPKPADLAVAAGSVFVLRAGTAAAADGLARLARAGVGVQRREGFGWLTVNPVPWTPPPQPTTDHRRPVRQTLAERDAAAVATVREDRILARWLAGELDDLAVTAETHGGPDKMLAAERRLLEHRRLRTTSPTVHTAVQHLAKLRDPAALRAASDFLRRPQA